MCAKIPPRIDPVMVRRFYEELDEIYRPTDLWNCYSHSEIAKTVRRYCVKICSPIDAMVLNVGSAGDSLGLTYKNHFHIDIAKKNLVGQSLAVCGSAECVPFANGSFDVIICVGSVINYCEAAKVVDEIGRVSKSAAHAIVEFDKNESFEFMFSDAWSMPASVINTFYDNFIDTVWVYSEEYIDGLMAANGFELIKTTRIHILSPLLFKLTGDQQFAARLAKLDAIFRLVPYINKKSCSAIKLYKRI